MTPPVRLLLARHGQTEWHHDNRYAGRSDIALTEIGQREAEALACRAHQEEPVQVICSPLTRAIKTAQPAATACDVVLEIEERLSEIDFGAWEGRTLEEIREDNPSLVEKFERAPDDAPFPDGEPLLDAATRALEVYRDLHRRYGGQKVLVIAHNTLLRLSLCTMLGIPLRNYRKRLPRIVNAAVSEVRFGSEGGALYSLNDSEHLKCFQGKGLGDLYNASENIRNP
jgi:broad specificity phosphatase PhoE